MNRYLKFPEMWRHILATRDSTAADWKIATLLLERAKFVRVVKLSNEAVAKMGISPRTKWRSLDRLARWGLVMLDDANHPGTSPRIKVLWLAGRQPRDG
jgi:hypothetical protein